MNNHLWCIKLVQSICTDSNGTDLNRILSDDFVNDNFHTINVFINYFIYNVQYKFDKIKMVIYKINILRIIGTYLLCIYYQNISIKIDSMQ